MKRLILADLGQFDINFFKKCLGQYINQKRTALSYSLEAVAENLQLNSKDILSIESGVRSLSQYEFEIIYNFLHLEENELLDMDRVVHSRYLLNVSRVLDANYPR